MNFETYLNQAWNDHATQSPLVADSFSKGFALVETPDQLVQLSALVTHVMGEHLARWRDGASILKSFMNHPVYELKTELEKALLRSVAVLEVGENLNLKLDNFTLSDQIRIMAVAASALAEREVARAEGLLRNALRLAETGLDHKDPAHRSLAITGNNLACALEEKKSRSSAETDLMILAAQTGRKYWELAGTWEEVAIAEYRLAMTFIQAKDAAKAFDHAQKSIEIRRVNQASDRFMFFGYQALALAEKQSKNELGFQKAVEQAHQFFAKLNAKDQAYCQPSLTSLI